MTKVVKFCTVALSDSNFTVTLFRLMYMLCQFLSDHFSANYSIAYNNTLRDIGYRKSYIVKNIRLPVSKTLIAGTQGSIIRAGRQPLPIFNHGFDIRQLECSNSCEACR